MQFVPPSIMLIVFSKFFRFCRQIFCLEGEQSSGQNAFQSRLFSSGLGAAWYARITFSDGWSDFLIAPGMLITLRLSNYIVNGILVPLKSLWISEYAKIISLLVASSLNSLLRDFYDPLYGPPWLKKILLHNGFFIYFLLNLFFTFSCPLHALKEYCSLS